MPNPVHKRQCESLFFTIENLPRHSQSLGEVSEHVFLFAAAQLPLRGEARRRFNKLVIESKSMTARGLASPDRADALCLTFAMPVSSKPKLRLVSSRDAVMPTGTSSWMGP